MAEPLETSIVKEAQRELKATDYLKALRPRWQPQQFAQFVLKYAPDLIHTSAIQIKQRFPQLRTSEKKIKGLITHPEYKNEIRIILELLKNRPSLANLYYLYVQNLVEKTWEHPTVKVADHLGTLSGQFIPTIKTQNTSNPELTPEQEQNIAEEVAKLMKIKRQQEGKE